PAPFNKARDKEEKFYFSKKQNSQKNDEIEFKFSNIVNAKILRSEKNNLMVIDKGFIAINSDIRTNPQKGLYLKANLPYINLDDFISLYSGSDSHYHFKIDKADIALMSADLFDRRFNNIKIEIAPGNGNTKFKINSSETSGNLLWFEKDNRLIARLNGLKLPSEIKKISLSHNTSNQNVPNLDVKIESLEVDGKKIGKLELISNTSKQHLNFQKFKLTSDTSIFQADGDWLDWNRNSKTNINFNWKINNLGNTLDFLGYNHFIKDGDAEINGQFKWIGSPINFDKTKIDGSFTLDIHKGTILKVEPGVGRFFGLVTLQSLPRRLSLDFRDLFGSGFIFDSINASIRMNNGIMKTTNFRMNGPAAEVFMSGETNIINETQDLNVKVTPHISDSLSIAALAGGPLAGAVAFVAQKVLKDPLNKVLTSEYRIIGTWEKPEEVNNSASDKIKTTIDNTKNLLNDKK
ncbi:MAG: YhdP family protein, partial [Candidatus Methylopumilus sp.]